MKPKNIKEFKQLIERYESITFEEIDEAFKNVDIVRKQNYLTGFGRTNTCTLCIKVNVNCNKCVFMYGLLCSGLDNDIEKSYNMIRCADTPRKLYNSYRNRAKVLRQYAKDNNINLHESKK